jgi:hypothetical protein
MCALYMPDIRAGHLRKRYGLRERPGAVLVDNIFCRFVGIHLRTPKESLSSLCTEFYEISLSRTQKLCSLLVLVLIESSFLTMFFGHPFILFSLEIVMY